MSIDQIVNTDIHQLSDAGWRRKKREELRAEGATAMIGFLRADALAELQNRHKQGLILPILTRRPIIFILPSLTPACQQAISAIKK